MNVVSEIAGRFGEAPQEKRWRRMDIDRSLLRPARSGLPTFVDSADFVPGARFERNGFRRQLDCVRVLGAHLDMTSISDGCVIQIPYCFPVGVTDDLNQRRAVMREIQRRILIVPHGFLTQAIGVAASRLAAN
ncbi:hypothetical protein ACVBGC_00410 [Burkholderia stagnalis]